MMAIQILLVEDHPAVAEGLALRLNRDPEFEVVDIAHRGPEAVVKASRLKPDLVLMDICLPDGTEGIEATRQIRQADPKIRVLVLTAHARDRWIEAAVAAGAGGFLSKEAPTEKLVEAIRDVLRGKGTIPWVPLVPPDERLTPREREVLQLMAQGFPNKVIAKLLRIGEQAVKNYGSSIFAKLGAGNRVEAVQRGIERGEIAAESGPSGTQGERPDQSTLVEPDHGTLLSRARTP
jgi:DNA-binding NarL/FixJ family response regulator